MKATEMPKGTVLVNKNDSEHIKLVAQAFVGHNPKTALFRLVPLTDQDAKGAWYSLKEVNEKFIKRAL